MKEAQHLEQNQTLRTTLAPQQVLYMQLLQMNGPAIEDEVRKQLDDNPALEIAEPAVNAPSPEDTEQRVSDMDDPEDDPADFAAPSHSVHDYSQPAVAEDTPDLYTYLNNQLGELALPSPTLSIAQYIIGNIDDNGYLRRSPDEIADDISISTGIDVSEDDVLAALKIVQSLDPPGIAARDLPECLEIQIERIRPVTLASRIASDIITKHFDLFAKRHLDRLPSRLGVSKENMQHALDLIQRLNPKPGTSITHSQYDERRNHITPDVGVDCDEGRCSVYLKSTLPQLQIERNFNIDTTSAPATERQAEAYTFIKNKRDEAEAFISALKQRSNTLLRVTEAIVRIQKDFFLSGDESKLKPMILDDIKAVTGLDISVISRATSGKYIDTANGTYPMKMFFNEAPTDDPLLSTHKIKDEIKKVVNNEDKRHPLSDDAIAAILSDNGLDIARRTVTKYRKDIGIPDSRLRKSFD